MTDDGYRNGSHTHNKKRYHKTPLSCQNIEVYSHVFYKEALQIIILQTLN